MTTVHSKYKDRLFCFLFGKEENRDWTLSLYNAVNGTHYTDPEEIQIWTIREVLYLGMHNDVSFLLAEEIHVYEQQSTFNPNMPLRQMQYTGNLYDRYLANHRRSKHGSGRIPLPVPKLITFYNGTTEQPDEQILRLSDSFPEGAEPDIDVRVRMININHGRNRGLLEACEPLREYSWLINEIRERRKTMSLEEAVNKAVDAMPKEFVIRMFLKEHRAEVRGMLLTEYNEAEEMELLRENYKEEGLAEGRAKGLAEGRAEGIEIGRKEGRKEGLAEGERKGREILRRTLLKLGKSEEEIEAIIREEYPGEA